MGRVLAVAAVAVFLASPAEAYYHYVHYLTRTGPYTPVLEAFDLSALGTSKTVTFFVSDTGPATYGNTDSFGSILSQVKQAAAAWNSVASSDLRVAFGGLEAYGQAPSPATPGGDVVFIDLPPGLLGMGAPTVPVLASAQTGQNGQFFPIARGAVYLTNNTNTQPGPSFLEEYYTTAVHEFGHALGLQHTWTAAAMSQDVIRNTSRARPLDVDDMAAISMLYGKPGWMANFGSISGRVTIAGTGPAVMASVVAIPPVGPAVSALTNPDGTYTINGLPPSQYLLYVHPLPPDAIVPNNLGVVLPKGPGGQSLSGPNGTFQTVFYPGVLNPAQATTFTIAAGTALANENFTVQARSSVTAYDIVTYSYLDAANRVYTNTGTVLITPAYVDVPGTQPYVTIAAEPNNGSMPATLQSATILGGGFKDATVSGYTLKYELNGTCCSLFFYTQGSPALGPRHLVFNFGNDIFVLPDGINAVPKGPPYVSWPGANADGTITINGLGLGPDSRVFFDGLQAGTQAPFSGTASQGSITVAPPNGASGQTSTITVFNSDGQNSMFLQAQYPASFAYPVNSTPQITGVNPSSLAAGYNSDGTVASVDIFATNANFVDGQVTVGFGTSDISVRRVWVVSPTHVVADVVVPAGAAPGAYEVSVISGFQAAWQPSAIQVTAAAAPGAPTIALPIVNAQTYQPALHPGDYVSIFGSNLSLSPASAQVTLNGAAVAVLYASSTQIDFQIPPGFPAGMTALSVNNGAANVTSPVYVQIDKLPPVIDGLNNAATAASVNVGQAANPGDLVNLLATGLDPGVVSAPSRVQVTVSGVPMAVQQIGALPGGEFLIEFAVGQSFGGTVVPVVVSVDGSASLPFNITAR